MIVIDASVAIKWIRQEESCRHQALLLHAQHLSATQAIIVPELFFIEIANALATKSDFSAPEVKTGLELIYQAHLNIYQLHQTDIFTAAQLAKKYKTSVYDMLYAVIAKTHHTTLITADENFLKKTRFKFVKLLQDIDKN